MMGFDRSVVETRQQKQSNFVVIKQVPTNSYGVYGYRPPLIMAIFGIDARHLTIFMAMMLIRPFCKPVVLATTCFALFSASCLATVSPEAPAGNAVVILVDDLGWRDLACMGSPVYETPHIDALAESGTLFTNAYAPSSICSPSRASLLTGSQPSRHGVYTVVKNRGEKSQWKVIPKKNRQFLDEDYPTIGTELTQAGIANGVVGKWHIAVSSPSNGFEEGTLGGYLGLPINYFAPFKLSFLPKGVSEDAYLPTFVRKAGTDFLERHKDERFFLYFSTYLPHDEINNDDEDPDSEGMFRLAAPQPVVEKYRQKIAAMKQAGRDLQGHDNPVYAAMIEETDRSVGAIIDKLEALQLREKTLGERNLFWNFPSYNDPEYPARRPRSALRRGDWKIIHRYEENGYELYNLKTDIGESTDLSQSHPEILQEMREQLADSYQRFGAASSLPPNPNYEPAP